VSLPVVRVAADGVPEQEVAAQDAVEVPLVDLNVPRLAVVDPAGPGSGEAVGLRLVLDAPAAGREADTPLDGMAELVGQHDGRQRPPVRLGEIFQQIPVVGDGVADRVVEGVPGHCRRVQRVLRAADAAGWVPVRVGGGAVDGEVAARERWELDAVEARERLAPEGLEVGDGVARHPVDRGVGRAGDAQLLGGHVDEPPGFPGRAGRRAGRRAGAAGQEHGTHPGHGERATQGPTHARAGPTDRRVGLCRTVIASHPASSAAAAGGCDPRGRAMTVGHLRPARAHGTAPTPARPSAALPIPTWGAGIGRTTDCPRGGRPRAWTRTVR
jgi:hypothetical protein